jgi:CRP-like cAMP-binding protein
MATTLPDRTVIQRTVIERNGILRALSSADLVRLQPHLEAVPLKARERLQSANRRLRSIYFPESGIASVVVRGGGQRRQAEVAMLGREWMTALPVVLGAERSPHGIFMQIEGGGQRISADDLRASMGQSVTMRRSFLGFAHAFFVQLSYMALANARGNIEERLARWLLMALDRVSALL